MLCLQFKSLRIAAFGWVFDGFLVETRSVDWCSGSIEWEMLQNPVLFKPTDMPLFYLVGLQNGITGSLHSMVRILSKSA